MRKWSKNNLIFISEEDAPKDFICVWEKKKQRSISQSKKTRFKTNNKFVYSSEKLFMHESQLKDIK